MMNDWYQHMVNILQLNGKGERTQQAYTRSVRMLSQFYGKTPDLVFRAGTPGVFPATQKRQSLVSQDHADLLLRDSFLLREGPRPQLAHPLNPARPK